MIAILGRVAHLRPPLHIYENNKPGAMVSLTVGAHGQHTLQDVKLVLTMTKVFSEGIVLGVRNFHSADSTFLSYWGNRATSLFFELLYHKKLMDTQTGLRYISINELPWLIKVKR